MYKLITPHPMHAPFYTKNSFKAILLLLVVSLAAKLPLLPLRWGSITADGIIYVKIAKNFSQMDLQAALSSETFYLPFYPLLIAIFHSLGGNWATSAIMVSFLCGWLVVIPFYIFLASIFDEKIALISSFFLILAPNFNFISKGIGGDATFMLVFILGIWFLWLACNKGGFLYWGGFIAFAIMATFTRNAGIVFIPLFVVWWAYSLRHDSKELLKLLIVTVLCVGLIVALFALYSIYIGKIPAKVYAIQNILTDLSFLKVERVRNELKLAELTSYRGQHFDFIEMARHYIYIIYMMGIVDLLIRACGYAIFPFVAIGLFWKEKWWDGFGRSYLLTIAFLVIAMNYVFLLKNNFSTARYLMPAAIVLFPLGGQGYIRLEGYLKRRFSINSSIVAVIVALLVVTGWAYKFNSMRKSSLTYRNLQDSISWVKTNTPIGAMIVTNYIAIPFSAERAYLNVECPGLDECIEPSVLKEAEADYIVYRDVNKILGPSAYRPEKIFYGDRFDIYVFKVGGEETTLR